MVQIAQPRFQEGFNSGIGILNSVNQSNNNKLRQEQAQRDEAKQDVLRKIQIFQEAAKNAKTDEERTSITNGPLAESIEAFTGKPVKRFQSVTKQLADLNKQIVDVSSNIANDSPEIQRAKLEGLEKIKSRVDPKGFEEELKESNSRAETKGMELMHMLMNNVSNDGVTPLSKEERMNISRQIMQGKQGKTGASFTKGVLAQANKNKSSTSSLTGEAGNRLAALKAGEGSLEQQALSLNDQAKLERSRLAGTGAAEAQERTTTFLLNEIQPLVDKLFTAETFGDKLVEKARNYVQERTQMGEQGTNLSVYQSIVNGVIAQFARSISGEKGVLTNPDIDRIMALMPQLHALFGPDTKKVAQEKMAFLWRNRDSIRNEILSRQGIKPTKTFDQAMSESGQNSVGMNQNNSTVNPNSQADDEDADILRRIQEKQGGK